MSSRWEYYTEDNADGSKTVYKRKVRSVTYRAPGAHFYFFLGLVLTVAGGNLIAGWLSGMQ